MNTSTRLASTAILFSAAGFALCLAALGSVAGWGVRFGELGTWVGGLGSAAAAGAAVAGLRRVQRAREEEGKERRARALLRVRRIELRIEPVKTSVAPEYPLGWTVSVVNASDRPIYEVLVGPTLTATPVDGGGQSVTVTMRHPLDASPGSTVDRRYPADSHATYSLIPGESIAWEYVSSESVVNTTWPFVPVTFLDEEARRFHNVPAGLTFGGKTVSRWVFSDGS